MDNSWLSFAPATTEIVAYAGEPPAFTITATSTKVIDGTFNVGVIDNKGVIDPQVNIRNPSPMAYAADLKVAASLAPGSYEGQFEVRLCRDAPTPCAQPVPGSPWKVPYRITVKPANNLTALSPLPGANGWSTYQGDAAHTGFVDANISAANFNRRWVRPIQVGGLSTEAGRVFVSAPDSFFAPLRALSEQDGGDLWQTTRAPLLSGPASAGGRVWTLALDQTGTGRELWAVDAATGATLSSTKLNNSTFPSGQLAPVPVGGSLFFVAEDANDIGRQRQADAAPEWRSLLGYPYAQQAARWTPAIGSGVALMFDLDKLWVADLATGVQGFSIQGPNPRSGSGFWTVNGAAVMGANGMVYVTAYNTTFGTQNGHAQLAAFDLNARSLRWTTSLNNVRSNPVLARGVVYVSLDTRTLLAVDAGTGTELWRWDAPAAPVDPTQLPATMGPNSPLLVVGDYAFVGIGQVTYAVDLRTHQLAWQYPLAGSMAVSANGILYISGDEVVSFNQVHKLVAVNLR